MRPMVESHTRVVWKVLGVYAANKESHYRYSFYGEDARNGSTDTQLAAEYRVAK